MLDQSRAWLAALSPARQSRLAVIHNPVSGRANGRRMRRYLRALRDCGLTADLRVTHASGDAEHLASMVTDETAGTLVVAGGDGTINEVINGAVPAFSPPIALLPLGTANVLHAELSLPTAPAPLAAAIAAGNTQPVYTPTANGRRFVVMAGAGFDAHVVADVSGRTKRLLGRGAYVLSALRTLLRFPFRGYDVAVDGVKHQAASVIIANAHYYGGRYTCAPDARLDDPDLHVCLFRRGGRWAALRYSLALLRGTLHRRPDVTIIRARHVEVRGEPGEPVQCDGDALATLPLTVEADGRALSFIVPPSGA